MPRVQSGRLRRLTAVAAAALMGVTVLLGLSAPAAAAPYYQRLHNQFGNRLCLDAVNDATSNPGHNGDRVQLWTCEPTNYWQWWEFQSAGTHNGNPVFKIVNWWGGTRCLDARTDGSTNPNVEGDPVQIWNCESGAANQLWQFERNTRRIRSLYGNQLCLDARYDAGGNPNQNGDKVQMWTCGGGSWQEWRRTEVSE
ncbi:RICIN domain-containing protein [Actinoplanes sp. NPDC089786]|uniref:RICIN domain-containing protein n=1 Tax=Actinoplanes sp. NPDC089786 TaxID=3155185 RepID=UPI0034265B4C